MNEKIVSALNHVMQSLVIYQTIKENLKKASASNMLPEPFFQTIADNCIQAAAVGLCKIFTSKKYGMHYAKVKGFDKTAFINALEKRQVSFPDFCDKIRSFRDKYEDGWYDDNAVKEIFAQALIVVEAYEQIVGDHGIIKGYLDGKESAKGLLNENIVRRKGTN